MFAKSLILVCTKILQSHGNWRNDLTLRETITLTCKTFNNYSPDITLILQSFSNRREFSICIIPQKTKKNIPYALNLFTGHLVSYLCVCLYASSDYQWIMRY